MSGAYERIDQLSVRVAAALESFDNVRLKQQARSPIDPSCNAFSGLQPLELNCNSIVYG